MKNSFCFMRHIYHLHFENGPTLWRRNENNKKNFFFLINWSMACDAVEGLPILSVFNEMSKTIGEWIGHQRALVTQFDNMQLQHIFLLWPAWWFCIQITYGYIFIFSAVDVCVCVCAFEVLLLFWHVTNFNLNLN